MSSKFHNWKHKVTFSKPRTYKTRTVLTAKNWIFIKSNSKDIEYDLVYCTLWTVFHFYLPQSTNAVWSNFKCACSVAWKATAQVQQKSTTNEKPQKTRNPRACTPWTVSVLSCREWDICTLRASCTRTWSRRTFFMTPIKWWSQTSGSSASLESFKRGGKKRHSGGLKNTTSAKVPH